ncbi:MAG: hypothetical protein N4J56_007149 [Chroococcidiopsis sp. SAG 2025]|uniref:Rha family transcriptional regulator n=1 Tax=Chroococcidiopsis sp. SAG 2025 TaxID=171389 RepID=UPI0029371578|nr:Rha family transcriptional regulator [Chroococcidiopsis sp. SAG 2025]MDV2997444.1 hypothetical protein [Chroococcidiopsis sp. SAG 2025]
MTNVIVIERDGTLVVDSRLIADRLAIAHKNLLATLDKYKQRTESAFGEIAFETRKSERGKPERLAWLTEEQATFLMTLSRNTDKVVQCKLELVEAFAKAKRVIEQVIPAQSNRIRELELELELARARDSAARSEDAAAQSQQRLLAVSQAIATLHGSGMVALILGKPDAVVERVTQVEKTILCNERGQPIKSYTGLSKTRLAKRYGMKKASDVVIWLESIGKADLLQSGLTAAPCQYLPLEYLSELDRLWTMKQGHRQRLLGE